MTSRDLQKHQTRHAFFQAVLNLSFKGHAFTSISLRQVTREVGVVPTAFYRHFSDMDELGVALVNETFGSALIVLRDYLHIGKIRTHRGQIAQGVRFFFESIDKYPLYWHFIVSERYGGNQAVNKALDEQIRLFVHLLAKDLSMQPAFSHLNATMLLLSADMGVNVFFSWVYAWLKMSNDHTEDKEAYINHCTQQAQLLFYGISNFRSDD